MCSILRHFSRRSVFDSYQEILLYEIGRKYSVLGVTEKVLLEEDVVPF
jgi:hypothetical protein